MLPYNPRPPSYSKLDTVLTNRSIHPANNILARDSNFITNHEKWRPRSSAPCRSCYSSFWWNYNVAVQLRRCRHRIQRGIGSRRAGRNLQFDDDVYTTLRTLWADWGIQQNRQLIPGHSVYNMWRTVHRTATVQLMTVGYFSRSSVMCSIVNQWVWGELCNCLPFAFLPNQLSSFFHPSFIFFLKISEDLNCEKSYSSMLCCVLEYI